MSVTRLGAAVAGALMLMLAGSSAARAETPAPEGFWRWGGFTLTTYSGRAEKRRVEVDLFQAIGRGGRMIAGQRERLAGGPESRSWADSKDCPALRSLPESLAAIEPIVLGREIPIIEETPTGYIVKVTADGPSYAIDAPAAVQRSWSGRVRLESSEGPVKVWVEDALVQLVGCWGDQPPKP